MWGSVAARGRVWATAVLGSSWTWGALVGALSWPTHPLAAIIDGEESAWLGLHLATRDGLNFGSDLSWTYGPLGFMHYLLFVSGPTFALAAAYTAVVRVGLGTLVVSGLRRLVPLPLAVLIAWLVAVYTLGDPELAVMAALAIATLTSAPGTLLRRVYPVLAGAIAGVEFLVKFNLAAASILLGAVVVLAIRRDAPRRVEIFAGVAALVATIGWLATRQGDPIAYIHNGLSVSTAFASGMMLEEPGRRWEYWGAALAVIALVPLVRGAAVRAAPRWALWLVAAITMFFAWKEGFVRHDGHVFAYFGTALVIGAMLAGARAGHALEVPVLALTCLAALSIAAVRVSPREVLEPKPHLDVLKHTVRVLVSKDRRAKLFTTSRDGVRAAVPMPPDVASSLRGHTVAVIPAQLSLLWAYDLEWQPTGVMQPYVTVSKHLDDYNAERLRRADGPQRVAVVWPGTVDGRFPGWDTPAGTIELFCRYREVTFSGLWAVLARVPNRCGKARKLSTVRASFGQTVSVPQPRSERSFVTVSIDGVGPSGLERVRGLLYRPRERRVTFNRTQDFRFVPDTAANRHIVSMPNALVYPGYPTLNPNANTIAVRRVGRGGGGLTYVFEEISVARSSGL
jgi:hypothetical protein